LRFFDPLQAEKKGLWPGQDSAQETTPATARMRWFSLSVT